MPADEWALSGDDPADLTAPGTGFRYSIDLTRYRPLCRSCHRRLDNWDAKTVCRHGHVITPETTYTIPSTGGRVCLTCKRDAVARHRKKLRTAK
jgi:hypothetical protein